MDFDEAVRRRRMCRNFATQPVGPEVIDRLIDRARRAPSAGHSQGWSFLVLEGPEETRRFWQAAAEPEWLARPSLPGLLRAPVVVVPFCSPDLYRQRYAEADKGGAPPTGMWTVDLSFATMLLLLGAVTEGLGALFFALREGAEGRLRTEFGVPGGWQSIGAVALGHPADGGGPTGSAGRGRRPMEEIVHRGRW